MPATALFSTLGRTAARGLETQLCGALAARGVRPARSANLKAGDHGHRRHRASGSRRPGRRSARASASRRRRAARSATGSTSRTGRSTNYQIVVPSTWNASPRDGKGQHGAYESALIGTPMADPKQPVEILRTIHSFDPCLACASHVIGPDGEELPRSWSGRRRPWRTSIGPITPHDVAAHAGSSLPARATSGSGRSAICHWVNVDLRVRPVLPRASTSASPILSPTGEPWNNFLMGKVRQMHFVFAYVFVVNFIWRIYWFWMGNNYARSGFPFVWRKAWWRTCSARRGTTSRSSAATSHLGHNALGGPLLHDLRDRPRVGPDPHRASRCTPSRIPAASGAGSSAG